MPAYTKTVWVNGTTPAINATNLNKIEQGIADAVRKDGSEAMSAQLVTIAGGASTPAIAPTGDSNTGIFFPAADTIAFGEGGTEVMRINSSSQIGIGTISPTALVSMHGAPQATSGAILTLRDTTATGANTTYGAISFLSSPGTDFSIGKASENANSALAFRNANTGAEFMRIDSSGNVGIGTNSPSDRLHIKGVQRIESSNVPTSNHAKLQLNASATVDYGLLMEHINNGVTDASISIGGKDTVGNIYFGTNTAGNSATTRMTITSAGNVGIGTTNPSTKLTLYDANTTIQINEVATGGTGVAAMRLKHGNNYYGWYVDSSNALVTYDYQASAERMRITSAGNVGIGVNPNVELHVKGTGEILRIETTAATGDNYIRFYAPSATTQGFIGYTSAANNNMSINQVLNSDLLFFTNNTERMRIQNSGGVIPSANNTYELGSATFRWSTIYAQNALNTSDARLKTDVAPSALGLDFIAALNPVQYKWIEGGNTVEKVQTGTETVELSPAIPAQPEVLDEDGNVIKEATQEVPAITEEKPIYETVVTPREGVRTHFGLIAQEVKSALPDGLDFAGWCLADKDDPNSTQSLGYTQLIAPMIKAIQELKAEVDALKAQLNGN